MKKLLIFLSCFSAAASAAPYYLATPPGGGLTPADWQPTYSLEGLYAVGQKNTPDTAGFRGGLELYSNGDAGIRHEFSVQIAPQWGNGHRHRDEARASQHLFLAPVTLGYTLNIAIAEPVFLTMGGKAGYAWGHYKESAASHHESGACGGFTFSAGAGLRIQCSERLYVHAGYEFGRTYTNTRHNDIWGQHIITAGLSWLF